MVLDYTEIHICTKLQLNINHICLAVTFVSRNLSRLYWTILMYFKHKLLHIYLVYIICNNQTYCITRMHSSRMRTVCCSDRLLGGGVFSGRGCLIRGCLPGGCFPGGCLPRGDLPDTPLWTEWQTGVKSLPGRNYVADGKNSFLFHDIENIVVLSSSICVGHLTDYSFRMKTSHFVNKLSYILYWCTLNFIEKCKMF